MASDDETASALVEQLRIQNAILLQLAAEQSRANLIAMGRDPDDASSKRTLAGIVEGNAIDIAELVDLEAVDRVAEVPR